MSPRGFRILTPEESAANDLILRFECPCAHAHHHGLFDGRTTCASKTDRPGPCLDCRRDCGPVRRKSS